MTEIGKRIKTVRIDHLHLTQEEFGRKIGLSKHSIYNIESRNENPRKELLELIAVTYGLSLEYLLTGEGPVKIDNMAEKLRDMEDIFLQLSEPNRAIIHAQMKAMLDAQNSH